MRTTSRSIYLTCGRYSIVGGWLKRPRLFVISVLLFIVFLVCCVSSLNGLPVDKSNSLPRGSYVSQQDRTGMQMKQKFTLILQTYNRSDLLIKLLNHYSGIHQLSRIIVVWNNVGETPPVDFWRKYRPHPVPVHFLQQTQNRMQNRIQPFSEIDTEGNGIPVDCTIYQISM